MSISHKVVTKILGSFLAIVCLSTTLFSQNAHAKVIGYIANTDGGLMFVTDYGCSDGKADRWKLYTTDAGGVVTGDGCMRTMNDNFYYIVWSDGGTTMINANWYHPAKQSQPPATPEVEWAAQDEATKLENYDHSKTMLENYSSQ